MSEKWKSWDGRDSSKGNCVFATAGSQGSKGDSSVNDDSSFENVAGEDSINDSDGDNKLFIIPLMIA